MQFSLDVVLHVQVSQQTVCTAETHRKCLRQILVSIRSKTLMSFKDGFSCNERDARNIRVNDLREEVLIYYYTLLSCSK